MCTFREQILAALTSFVIQQVELKTVCCFYFTKNWKSKIPVDLFRGRQLVLLAKGHKYNSCYLLSVAGLGKVLI